MLKDFVAISNIEKLGRARASRCDLRVLINRSSWYCTMSCTGCLHPPSVTIVIYAVLGVPSCPFLDVGPNVIAASVHSTSYVNRPALPDTEPEINHPVITSGAPLSVSIRVAAHRVSPHLLPCQKVSGWFGALPRGGFSPRPRAMAIEFAFIISCACI